MLLVLSFFLRSVTALKLNLAGCLDVEMVDNPSFLKGIEPELGLRRRRCCIFLQKMFAQIEILCMMPPSVGFKL